MELLGKSKEELIKMVEADAREIETLRKQLAMCKLELETKNVEREV